MLSNIYKFLMTPVLKIYYKVYTNNLRKRLQVKNFSIICSNCVGGVIYHRLGQKFLTPTINLWLYQDEFIKFCENLHYYLNCDLKFMDTAEFDFPVAMLDDIHIFFNHAKTNEEAEEDWNKRRGRVNYENLYIIMFDGDGITKDDMLRLENIDCRNKIVISSKEYPDIPYVKTIKPNLNKTDGERYMDRDWLLRRTFEKKWDFVSWLNEGAKNRV